MCYQMSVVSAIVDVGVSSLRSLQEAMAAADRPGPVL